MLSSINIVQMSSLIKYYKARPGKINDTSSLENGFISVTEAFKLVQHVKGPTHNSGHTHDLLFILGVTLGLLELKDSVMFDTSLHPTIESQTCTVKCCLFNSQSVVLFFCHTEAR